MSPRNPTLAEIASCVSGYDPDALPVAQAQEFIARLVPRVQAVEKLAIRSALGRVLASDVISTIAVPAHDNSAMDGFAFDGAVLAGGGTTVLRVAGTAHAGRPFGGAIAAMLHAALFVSPWWFFLALLIHGSVLMLALTTYRRQQRAGRINGLLALALSYMMWFVWAPWLPPH